MPKHRDLYEILGVPRTATDAEIRKAYLKLAHKYHPDKTGGDKAAEEKLKEINAAYATVKNPEKRAKYDRFGDAAEQFAGGGGFGAGDFGFGGGAGETPFDDFFDVLFGRRGGGGGAGRRSAAVPGNDLEYRISITMKEAAFGTKRQVKFARAEQCGDCRGSGAAAGSKPEPCRQCGGSGQVRMSQGFFSVTRTCPACRGAGQTVSHPCSRCSGSGRVRTQRELSVDIPAGVDTGSRLRVSGEGEAGINGGPRGDLYIYIEVQTDDFFVRDGNDIVCEVPISFTQASLGATVRVPTLEGEAELKVPAGTQPGTLMRLRGLGFPDIRGYSRGDQIVRVQVETPTKLSREQRELLQKFEELSDAKTYPLHKRFIDQLKRSFGG